MKLKELKDYLQATEIVKITEVPEHFHITEVGYVTKEFVDCGGTEHNKHYIHLQIWVADDVEHRLESKKLLNIIEPRFEDHVALNFDYGELEVLFEYNSKVGTIGTYKAEIFEGEINLINIQTDCLAKDICLPKDQSCGPGCC